MNCPFCSLPDTRVMDSRHLQESNTIKRRRKCDACGRRFTTFEKMELDMPIIVKNDKRRENYDRQKMFLGIQKACQKRPVAVEQIETLINGIEKQILEKNTSGEVTTQELGEMVIQSLRGLDTVAYVRFASVYKTFQDIDEFVKDLKKEEGTLSHASKN